MDHESIICIIYASNVSCNIGHLNENNSNVNTESYSDAAGIQDKTCQTIVKGLYGRKSDPEAKVIPKPNHVCKTAKLIPK